ncbi:hypothetical protein GSS87_01775 [Corynebacterium sp. 4HC-13]|uniref:hypothetical protein n=1 Tax=Corynebacterium anserum TaxID=2684406 RepID=UPI00163A56E6|nr:hypothetical protein [Corynebacterium anserum]MBC2681152.1 hypothetical protein [Corynebacterium anserum]
MNSDIRWGLPDDGHTFPIYAGPSNDLDRVAEYADERGVTHLRFGGDTWNLEADQDAEISAETATGKWTARGNKESFKKSDRYVVQADRHTVEIIAESSKNFVLDIDGQKAGQFTSNDRGLRNLHVEFEGPGEKLPLDVQIFISWVARRCMEVRMVSSVWAWTILMVIFIPIAILYWIGFF